jgi:hypothetical protein
MSWGCLRLPHGGSGLALTPLAHGLAGAHVGGCLGVTCLFSPGPLGGPQVPARAQPESTFHSLTRPPNHPFYSPPPSRVWDSGMGGCRRAWPRIA